MLTSLECDGLVHTTSTYYFTKNVCYVCVAAWMAGLDEQTDE